jgi:hypothetical protein
MTTRNEYFKHTVQLLILLFCTCFHQLGFADAASLAKNDPWPLYTAHDPQEFLLSAEQYEWRGVPWASKKGDIVSLTLSPFGLNADRGKSVKGEATFDPETNTNTITPLGDLTGRSSMIALLFGNLPAGVNELPRALELAKTCLKLNEVEDPGDYIDPKALFGYFSFPLKYRERGLAWEFMAHLFYGFGCSFQGRYSNIQQTSTGFVNTTLENQSFGTDPVVTSDEVNLCLMDKLATISQDMGVDLSDFVSSGLGELRFNLFWRYPFDANPEQNRDWVDFFFIPFFEVCGSVSPHKLKNESEQFAVPFGNNGHNSATLHGGANLDFIETIEIGFDAGFTHFFKKDFSNFRVPNSIYQTTLFPFATNVTVQPGLSTFISLKMYAIHFLDYLSCYFQYLMLEHKDDKITLKTPDPAFLPDVLENVTSFKVRVANVGFTYDLSPRWNLGFAAQLPFSQRNAYRSTTILFSLNATF